MRADICSIRPIRRACFEVIIDEKHNKALLGFDDVKDIHVKTLIPLNIFSHCIQELDSFS